MSKTADQLVKEADRLDDEKRHPEALKLLDEAIALDPKHGQAHFLKGFILDQNTDGTNSEEIITLYKKAHEYGYVNGSSLENLANQLMATGHTEDAIDHYLKSHEKDNKRTNPLAMAGFLYEFLGNKAEALKCYEKALAQDSTSVKANYYKGMLLSEEGKYTEAIQYYKKALSSSSTHPGSWYHQGKAHLALGNKEEANNCFSKTVNHKPRNSIEFCNRGQCLMMLGRKEEAMKDFKECEGKMELDRKKAILSPQYINYMQAVLKSVFEAEEASTKVEAAVSNLDQTNPAIQKFVASLKVLQQQKDQAQANVLKNAGQASAEVTNNKDLTELNKITEEFRKRLAEVENELVKVKTDVKKVEKKVENLENNMLDLKEELNNKMDDFNKKLSTELQKLDLSPEDQEKLKGYFKAFVETFASIYVTSQVVDSGQVQLDTSTNTATALSFVASFAPFIGNTLQSGIKSLGDFIQSKEMKTNARKVKRLASDSSQLSQLIGKTAYEVIMDRTKRDKIINTTDEDLQSNSNNLFKKLMQFCDDLQEKVDVYLYSELYQTCSERVGHNDANKLIELWVKGDITPYGIEKQFIGHIINVADTKEEKSEQLSQPKEAGRSACCNIF